jgi:hypothetical protein
LGEDVGPINLLLPIFWFDFLKGYGNRFRSIIQNLHDILGDLHGSPALLLFRFAGPELDDYVRHVVPFLYFHANSKLSR